MTGVFVTGTDTGVGKTLVSAWLVRSWGADYWKPIQSGAEDDSDAATLRQLVPGCVIHPSTYVLQAPLSPHEAARREGLTIDLAAFTPSVTARPLVVEGAGGALVPLNARALMVDLMARLALPVVVVARSGLGTINHTLLTLEALARRSIRVAGVILNGDANPANRQAIEAWSGVPVVGELPILSSPAALAAHPALGWTP